MKLYYLKDSNYSVYYRMTKVYESYSYVTTTGVLERAAFFLSLDVAQDVANDLMIIGERYKVVEYIKENSNV